MMAAKMYFPSREIKPVVGMNVAFKASAPESFVGVAAQVTYVWPRFRSGDYLVTLALEQPVRTKEGAVAHIDAFMSELDPRR